MLIRESLVPFWFIFFSSLYFFKQIWLYSLVLNLQLFRKNAAQNLFLVAQACLKWIQIHLLSQFWLFNSAIDSKLDESKELLINQGIYNSKASKSDENLTKSNELSDSDLKPNEIRTVWICTIKQCGGIKIDHIEWFKSEGGCTEAWW